jgi:hypothetical protein
MSNSLSKKFLGDAPQRREFAKTGIGENDIESALLPDDLQVGKFGYVSLNAGNVAPDRLHGLIEFLLATAGDEDVRAFLDEELGGSQANSRCAAGDDCHFALKLTHDSYRAPTNL